jgi:hypothetical protein
MVFGITAGGAASRIVINEVHWAMNPLLMELRMLNMPHQHSELNPEYEELPSQQVVVVVNIVKGVHHPRI